MNDSTNFQQTRGPEKSDDEMNLVYTTGSTLLVTHGPINIATTIPLPISDQKALFAIHPHASLAFHLLIQPSCIRLFVLPVYTRVSLPAFLLPWKHIPRGSAHHRGGHIVFLFRRAEIAARLARLHSFVAPRASRKRDNSTRTQEKGESRALGAHYAGGFAAVFAPAQLDFSPSVNF